MSKNKKITKKDNKKIKKKISSIYPEADVPNGCGGKDYFLP